EGPGQRQQQVLPQGPQGGSLHKAPPGVQSHPCSNPTGRVCTRGALVNPPGRPTPVCPFMSPGSWLGNYCLGQRSWFEDRPRMTAGIDGAVTARPFRAADEPNFILGRYQNEGRG